MERTWKPTTAGILTIIAGAAGIVGGALIVLFGGILGLVSALAGTLGEIAISGALGGILGMIGGASIGLGIVALIGGIFALRRRRWGLALAGAICATACMTSLGILAIIFVSMGRREFA
jgi:hypothetical protein